MWPNCLRAVRKADIRCPDIVAAGVVLSTFYLEFITTSDVMSIIKMKLKQMLPRHRIKCSYECCLSNWDRSGQE